MKKIIVATFILTACLSAAHARQSIREGEQSGIPDREDIQKEMKETDREEVTDKKKETRENQEDTDPVFYDSTTSPKEMEEKSTGQD